MSFNTVCAFVETKPFRLNASITSIFHRLRVNHYQCRPLRFFFNLFAHFIHVELCLNPMRLSHPYTSFGNARTRWNMAVDLWVSQTSYNRS